LAKAMGVVYEASKEQLRALVVLAICTYYL
jgi:hypothetical protein